MSLLLLFRQGGGSAAASVSSVSKTIKPLKVRRMPIRSRKTGRRVK